MTTLKSIIESGDYRYWYNDDEQIVVTKPVTVAGKPNLIIDVVARQITIKDCANVTIANSDIATLVVRNSSVDILNSYVGTLSSDSTITLVGSKVDKTK